MARFISYRGKLYPAVEEVSLTYNGKESVPKDKLSKYITIAGDALEPGGTFIYRGPDREAVRVLKEAGGELGTDFEHDPDFLSNVRKFNFNSVEDYLKFVGYNADADKARFDAEASKISKHELPDVEDEAFILAGGQDKSGNAENDIVGGFGEPKVRPKSELRINKTKAGV